MILTPENWELPADPVTGEEEGLYSPAILAGILAASGQVYYSFIGFDAVCLLSQEAKNAEIAIPIALFSSLIGVFCVYGFVSLALTGMEPVQNIDVLSPLSSAFLSHNCTWAFHLITFAAMTNTLRSQSRKVQIPTVF